MNILRRMLLPASFALIVLLVLIPISPLYAASTCAGFIPGTITTQANLIAAVNAANNETNCPGADVIDLNGQTITMTTVSTSSGTDDVALPTFTSNITIQNGTLYRDPSAPDMKFIYITNDATVVVNNMTLQNGVGTLGSAIDTNVSLITLTISNSSILNNTTLAGGAAGAVHFYGDILTVQNSTFRHNTGAADGGAISHQGNTLNVTNSIFEGNTATANGAAINSDGFTGTLHNLVFVGNAGVNVVRLITSATMNNVLFAGNVGRPLRLHASAPSSTFTLNNSIIWGNNGSPSTISNTGFSSVTVNYSAVEGYTNGGIFSGTNNITDITQFTLSDFVTNPLVGATAANTGLNYNPASYSWGLRSLSPAIDAANRAVAPAGDIQSNARVDDANVTNTGAGSPNYTDMGPYERVTNSCTEYASAYPYTLASGLPNELAAANVRTAVGCANIIPGDQSISLGGQSVTFTTARYAASGDPVTLPTITSNITLQDGTFDGNAGEFKAIYQTTGTLNLTNLTAHNFAGVLTANEGGVILVSGASAVLNISGSTFYNNGHPYTVSGTALSGAVIRAFSGTVNISDSSFYLNEGRDGGVIDAGGSTALTITDSLLYGNTVAGTSSIILVETGASLNLANSLVVGNQGGNAPIENWGAGNVTITNTTIAGNLGGGYRSSSGTATIQNSVLWGNSNNAIVGTIVPTIEYSAVQNYGGTITGGFAGSAYTADQMFVTPLTSPSAANTGLNYTHGSYNWQLENLSPAIDGGNNALFTGLTDLAGAARKFEDPGVSNKGLGTAPIIDMGAYEHQTSSCTFTFPYTLTGGTNSERAVNLAGAINCANINGTADVIDLNGMTVTLFSVDGIYAGGSTALPSVTSTITLQNGTIERDSTAGTPDFRLLHNTNNLTLTNVTVRNGRLPSGNGGNIANIGGSLTITDSRINAGFALRGAGIYSGPGVLTVTTSRIDGNNTAGGGEGGGFYNSGGSATINRSTISGNFASTNGGGFASVGAATFINNSTFTGNQATTRGGAGYLSGGSGLTTLRNVTVNNSTTPAGTGAIDVASGTTLNLYNSILANTVNGSDCYRIGTVTFSAGTSNIIENDSPAANNCGAAGTNYLAVDPNLGVLTGVPAYYPLNVSSPAINAGDNSALGGFTVDQPGNARQQGGIVDLGAFESSIVPVTITLAFDAATSSAAEASGIGNVLRVTTSDGAATTTAVTVTVTVSGGTATAADYNLTGTITIPAGTANNALVSIASGITVTNDAIVEGNETLGLTLSAPANATLGAQTTTTHTITNDETATVTVADVSQAEGNAGASTMTFTVMLGNAVQGGFDLDYTTTNLLATTADNDYVAASGTLTFAGTAGETQTFTVTINGDTKVEANETFQVSFPTASGTMAPGSLIITDTATGTITNDDTANVTIADVAVTEGNAGTSVMTFTATLDNVVQGGFTVNYATVTGTATTADADYVAATGTLNFTGVAGQTRTFTVTINGDTKVEADETFTVSMNTVSNASVNVTDTATGTITNDDTAAVTIADVSITEGNAGPSNMIFTVTLDNAVQGGFTVNYTTVDGTATTADNDYVAATGTLTFTGIAGQTRTFVVTTNGDTRLEGDETFTVSLNTVSNAAIDITDTATGTLINNDTAAVTIADVTQAENGTFTFTATLSNATGSAFSVDWALAAGTTSAADYVGGTLPTGGTLNFTGTTGETRTFTVPVFNDVVVEPTETFTISLTNFATAGGFVATTTDTATGTVTDNDTSAVTIADVSIAEGDAGTTLMTFTATLSNGVQGGFTVNYATADATAAAGSDYVAATGTLTFAGTAGETQTFTVTINGDTTLEANETFTVSMNTVSNAGVTITDTAIGTITNDDGATVTIDDVALVEGNAGTSIITFTATLGGSVSGGFTVNYAAANGTATTADADYVAATGTLTFAGTAGETKTFNVTINGDTKLEANETFTVSLNTVSNAGVTITDTATGTITNDDTSSVTIADASITEGNAGTITMTFTATLSNAVQGGFTVNYATANGTATTADADYAAATGTLTFVGTAGEIQIFAVTINGDTKVEANETFTVSMNTVSNTGVTITDTATGTITNDDAASVTIGPVTLAENGTFTFTAYLDNATNSAFSVDWVLAAGTTNAADYVGSVLPTGGTLNFAGTAGETQVFTVPVLDDAVVEASETFTISMTNFATAGGFTITTTDTATGTITDNDTAAVTIADVSLIEGNAGTSLMTFTATLNNDVQGGFTVNYATANGTATTGDNDYVAATGTLTFAGTAGETHTFTVTINGNTVVEADETFTVSLNTVSNALVTITDTATGTITNDDGATVTIADASLVEGNAGTTVMTFTATLGGDVAGGFTVNYATANGTATTGDNDYVAVTGTLTFAGTAGETETFTVTINGDPKVEANETFTVSLNTVSNAAVTITDTAVGTITNDDAAAVTIADVSLVEGNAGTVAMTFTATLDNAVQGGFTVNYATADGTATTGDNDYVAATGTLTFAGTAGETQTFTVTINGDVMGEADETFTVSLNTVSNALVTITDTATGTITNDEGTSITIDDVSLVEGNAGTSLMTFTATSSGAVVGGFTVNYATSNGTATTGDNDYVATTGTLTFAGAMGETQTFTVTINGDTKVEANETFTVDMTGTSNASVIITDTALGTITNDDAAAVTITDVSQAEGDAGTSTMTFTATLNNAVQGGFTVNYATANGTATTGDNDYAASTGTLTFGGTAGETQTFTVTINGDTKIEADETFTVALNNVSNAAVTITDTATGTITSEDSATVTITDVAQVEGNAGTSTIIFAATVDHAVAGGFAVNYATANGTATTGDNDYVAAAGTLTFVGTAGEIQIFAVTINGDTKIEADETFTVSLNTVSNPAITITDTAIGTITNDDSAAVTIADVSLVEGNTGTSAMTFTATLDNAVQGGFTVNYATANGTATTGDNDYVAATGTLTFAGTAGETQTFAVTINGETTVEPDETFTVALNTVSNTLITITDTATGTITNDDAAGYIVDTAATAPSLAEPTGSTTFTIRLASQPVGTVALDFGSTDLTECSVTPTTFTFNAANWNAAQTITLTVVDDLLTDGTQPCAATITRNASSTAAEYALVADPANVTLTITDNETPGITVNPTLITLSETSGTSTFDMSANTSPLGAVTVPLTTDGQCEVNAGSGFGTTGVVTLPAGSTALQTVTVRAVNDTVIEGAHTCAITTGDPTSAADAFYDGVTAAQVADVTANVSDNDVLHTLAAGAGGAEGTGTNPTYTFTITRSGATNVISSVDYSLGGTGVSGTDYVALNPAADITGTGVTATATTITFAPNATTAVITMTVSADSIVEGNFTLDLTLTNAVADGGAGTGTLTGSPATLTVTDDDTAGYTIDTTSTAASIGEVAGVTTFSIRLTSQPTGTVILDFASSDTTECTVSPLTFTFDSSNWSASQTITITAADDLVADGAQPCAIVITRNASSTDAGYAAVANPADVSVTVTDNETPGITVNAPLITSINELGGTTSTTFTIVLNTQPTGDVSIPLTSSDTTECTISPTPLLFTALDWNTAQTVTITAVDDVITDGNQPCLAQIGSTTSTDASYNAQDPADVTITVVDNDAPGLTFSAATVTEGAGAQTYTLQLNSQPTADVQITAITPDAQCTISGVTLPLTFTTADWNVPQTITVTAIDDAAVEGNHACVVAHTVSSTDVSYTALGAVNHTITVVDNDAVVVTPTPAPSTSTDPSVEATTTPVNGCSLRLSGIGVVTTGQSNVARLGDTATWTYTVENLSPCDLADVNVLITFPDDDMVGVQATSSLGINGTFRKGSLLTSYTLGMMKPGQSVTLTIVTRLPDRAGLFLGTLTATVGGLPQPESATLQLLAAVQLPATGETPWWAGWAQGGLMMLIGAALLMGMRRVYLAR